MSNQAIFETPEAVQSYGSADELQKPEQTILQLFEERWSGMKFLDIGVGGGRTAIHFGPRVKEYVGVDYARGMIAACQARFKTTNPGLRFAFCDARKMDMFGDQSFDFVLFSYNGIDYVSHSDRLQVLEEVRRILGPGGHFLFSSHNIRYLPLLFRIPRNPFKSKLLKRLRKWILLHQNNSYAEVKHRRYAVIRDGTHNFQSEPYYILPDEQIAQLNRAGFPNVRTYSLADGGEISQRTSLAQYREAWLYYLCKV